VKIPIPCSLNKIIHFQDLASVPKDRNYLNYNKIIISKNNNKILKSAVEVKKYFPDLV
jgi:hypothetical protein